MIVRNTARRAGALGRLAGFVSGFAVVMLIHSPVQAFSTRVHMAISNKIRAALIASGDYSIPLKGSDKKVTIPAEDAEAILNYPTYFRAGCVGPDNFIFPAQTDASHAVGHRPYEQCQRLYDNAVMPYERAYALGCFLHGATDAMAHHYVNFLTGETFTLNPLADNRANGFSNVIRHIVAESMIQDAFLDTDPAEFTQESMSHTLPVGYLLRNYYTPTSELWELMGGHQRHKWEEHKAAHPDMPALALLATAGLAPWEHLVLMPIYIEEIDLQIVEFRANLEWELEALKQDSSLQPTPGPDQILGTFDDKTGCDITCPQTYAKYFVHVGLLLERRDAWDDPLPAPIDLVLDKLRQDLHELNFVMVTTIAGLSAKLNEGLVEGQHDEQYNLSPEQQTSLLAPLTEWQAKTFNLDTKTLLYSILPTDLQTLDSLLANTGLNLTAVIENALKVLIDPIKKQINDYIVGQIKEYLEPLLAQLQQLLDPLKKEYTDRLNAASDPALGGNLLQHWKDSGLFYYSFNITAVTLANHGMILPNPDLDDNAEGAGLGPATFDAAYTMFWSQPGLCDYLRDHVFPFGMGMNALITVKKDGKIYKGDAKGDVLVPSGDAPIECHDGAYNKWATAPSETNCFLTTLDVLLTDKKGCMSRGFPPEFHPVDAVCRNLVVPGLPLPPSGTGSLALTLDETQPTELPSAPSVTPPGVAYEAPVPETIVLTPAGEGGCQGGASRHGAWLAALFGGLWLAVRRRRAARAALAVAGVALLAQGCDSADPATGGSRKHAATPPAAEAAESIVEEEEPPGAPEAVADPVGLDEELPIELYPRMHGLRMADEVAGTPGDPEGMTLVEAYGLEKATSSTLVDELGTSVWCGVQARYEGDELVSRLYEVHFDAPNQEWGEIRNPWGPARLRRFRGMEFDDDGLTVNSVVITVNDWPYDPENGTYETWTFQILDGTPRRLLIAGEGRLEAFLEGACAQPTGGLTAHARAFDTGTVENAFCLSGIGFLGNNFDYDVLWKFARAEIEEDLFPDAIAVNEDWVAGAPLMSYFDGSGNNQFALTNVNGFDRHGGTELVDQYNFTVRYTGTITHPGGQLCMREDDQLVEDGLWVYLGGDAGTTTDSDDLFLEVHGFLWSPETGDEPCTVLPKGDIAVEILMIRCAVQIEEVRLEMKLGSGSWKKVGLQPTKPEYPTELFPPVLY
jgi:hypothetical protein